MKQRWMCIAASAAVAGAASSSRAQWTTLAGGNDRVSITEARFPSLAAPAWICSTDAQGNRIYFIGPGSAVAFEDLVYAVGRIRPANQATMYKIFAIRRTDGTIAWSAPLAPTAYSFPLSSYSTPAIDPVNRTIIVPSDDHLIAFRLGNGEVAWDSTLARQIVNASPLVVNAAPLGGGKTIGRVFITDFATTRDAALYCINIDPYDAKWNPYVPGQVVWLTNLPGAVGNTPAYAGGNVFVASVGVTTGPQPARAEIRAYPAGALDEPVPCWVYVNPERDGYFGGVSARGPTLHCDAGAVYAATYNFCTSCGHYQSKLVKLDAKTGCLVWDMPVAVNRTDSIPIPLDDGRIVLSGGIAGFGSLPSVELIRDDCDAGVMLWDSALDTWDDLNGNGSSDLGEYLAMGGRTQQPVVSTRGGRPVLLVPTPPLSENDIGYSTDLRVVDLSVPPSSPAFILDAFVGAGSSPCVVDRNVYTIGHEGLYAFGPRPPSLDVNRDGVVSIDDLSAWERGFPMPIPLDELDADGNGIVDNRDREEVRSGLRVREVSDLSRGR